MWVGVCWCWCVGVCGLVCVGVWSRFAWGENPIRVEWRGLGCVERPPAGPPLARPNSRSTAISQDRPFAGPPKISRFFSFSRSHVHSFFLSLGICSLNFGVLKRWDPQVCAFGVLGVSCEALAAKIQREDPQRERKNNENGSGRRKEKRESLGLPPFGPPPFGAPFGSTPLRPHPFGAPPLPNQIGSKSAWPSLSQCFKTGSKSAWA